MERFPYHHFSAGLIVSIVVASGICGATWIDDWLNYPTKVKSLARELEQLPAAFFVAGGSDRSPIEFVRIMPKLGNAPRKFDVLSNRLLNNSLISFDAYECRDFCDSDLRFIASCNKIRGITLAFTGVSDEGIMQSLTCWPRLTLLDIQDCNLNQASVEAVIKNHRSLKVLRLSSSKIDIARLRQFTMSNAPRLIIDVDGSDIMEQPDEVHESVDWSWLK